jgi:hypothetical protein
VLLFVMAGAPLPARGSARYAPSLADDPGSSVLTLTSLGLMNRTNAAGVYPLSHNIALWKDDTGRAMEISCPPSAQAVLLTLGGDVAKDQTVDGRPNQDTTSWRYQGHQPISLPKSETAGRYRWIVEGEHIPAGA